MSLIRNILISNLVAMGVTAAVAGVIQAVQKKPAPSVRMGGAEYSVDYFWPDEVVKIGKTAENFDDRGKAITYAAELSRKSPEFRVIIFRQDNDGKMKIFRIIEPVMRAPEHVVDPRVASERQKVLDKTIEEILTGLGRAEDQFTELWKEINSQNVAEGSCSCDPIIESTHV